MGQLTSPQRADRTLEGHLGRAVESIAIRMNRRGFLGGVSKGALVLMVASAGALGLIGSDTKAALACVYCSGCTSACTSQAACCRYTYTNLMDGSTWESDCCYLCSSCGYWNCFTAARTGNQTSVDCGCGCYDCTPGS